MISLGSVSANAVTVINHSNKASPGTVFAQSFHQAAGTGQWFQATTCEQAKIKFDRTQDAVMIYSSSVGVSALNKGLSCSADIKSANDIIMVTQTYFGICRKPTTESKFGSPKTRMGIASVILAPGMIADYNSNGLDVTAVPYGGSKDVLAAVIAGDVSFGMIGSGIAAPAVKSGQIVCDFSTDPAEKNFVGNTFKLKIPDLSLKQVIYTNSKDPAVTNTLRRAANDKTFQEFLSSHGFVRTRTQGFTEKDVRDFDLWIKNTYETYWK